MKSAYAISVLIFVGTAFVQAATDSSTGSAGSASASSTASAESGAAAPKSTAAPASSQASASSVIPTGISSGCSAFLTGLNSNAEFSACIAPLLTATTAFAPTANNASLTPAALVSTLDTFCSATRCSKTFLRQTLSNFSTACMPDMTGSDANTDVVNTFDIMYVMEPLTDALCTQSNGTYCVLQAPSNSTSTSTSSSSGAAASGVANAAANFVVTDSTLENGNDQEITNAAISLFNKNGVIAKSTPSPSVKRRAAASNSTSSVTSTPDQSVIQYAPDTQVFRESNVMYLYTTPSLSSASLCTMCTQAILTAYAVWEAATPYPIGLSKSPILGGQAALWTSASAKCGPTFMSNVQAAVGPVVHGVAGALAGGSGAMGFTVPMGGIITMLLVAVSAIFAL
ncbi:hypothetical protein FRB96_004554 [Tulasnella sp. 330]|nr:hypothetical protein FRB96_004554 [Tulasnella sp. 330]KAG8885676.1 hypothetical protein FRB97_000119 [Tulasnella sp. 331]